MKSHRKEGFRRWIQNEDYERKSSKNISNNIRQFNKDIKRGGEGYLSDMRD